MRKGPLNPKYIRVEVRIDLLTVNISRIDQVVGIEDSTQVIGLDNTIEMIVLEEILGVMEDRIVEEDIEMIDIMIITEAETGQEKGHLQEIIVVVVVEIGVQVTVDLGQAPELIQIEIGLDVIIAENVTIFARDCSYSREERELERLQQMLDMQDGGQTYRQDSPIENCRCPLNL